jgi:hypothetical protein
MTTTRSSAPIFVVSLLLLLLLATYVSSYLVLAVPAKVVVWKSPSSPNYRVGHYRYGSGYGAEKFYWPLEQLDRQVRPAAWKPAGGLGGGSWIMPNP